ncbi:putative HTH-type transcriptional regulator RB1450 [Kaistia sp. 32K]|nr:putative HTH-type transcriptional regulator RB1450 [Kaistia sp. 32K]
MARGRGIAAWRQIADEIEADIRAGRLGPGMQLPTESQLAVRFAVNRHTVRRSLAELAARGLVRATQGRGTFVEDRPIPYPIGARTRFSENVSRAGREAGGKLLDAYPTSADRQVAAALGIDEGAPVVRMDTVRYADGTPISLGSAYFPLPRFSGLIEAYRSFDTLTAALEACGVADYRRHETRISARPAGAEEATRLDLAPGRLLLTVDSINVDIEGQPIQFTRAAFSADRTELVIGS